MIPTNGTVLVEYPIIVASPELELILAAGSDVNLLSEDILAISTLGVGHATWFPWRLRK